MGDRLLFGILIHRTDKTVARQFGRFPPLTRDKFDLVLIFRVASSWFWLPSPALCENPSGRYDWDACGGNGIRPIWIVRRSCSGIRPIWVIRFLLGKQFGAVSFEEGEDDSSECRKVPTLLRSEGGTRFLTRESDKFSVSSPNSLWLVKIGSWDARSSFYCPVRNSERNPCFDLI